MKKIIALVCLLSAAPALQATDYKNVKALMQDFLNLRKKKDKPLTYWISELIQTIQHEKKLKPFISALRRAKQDPEKLLKAFKKHSCHFDNGVKVCLMKAGNKAIQKAFDVRSQTGSPLAVTAKQLQALTPAEKVAVITTIQVKKKANRAKKATPVVNVAPPAILKAQCQVSSAYQQQMMAWCTILLTKLEEGSLKYTPTTFDFGQWKRSYNAALRIAQ